MLSFIRINKQHPPHYKFGILLFALEIRCYSSAIKYHFDFTMKHVLFKMARLQIILLWLPLVHKCSLIMNLLCDVSLNADIDNGQGSSQYCWHMVIMLNFVKSLKYSLVKM